MTESQPKYLWIYEELLRKIRKQSFLPGELLPTEDELCKQYGVSRPTVARALKRLSDEKRVQRKAGFGTQVLGPESSAQSVGLLIPQMMETEIFQPIVTSIAETAEGEEMRVVNPPVFNLSSDLEKATETIASQLIEAGVQGVFFAPAEHVENPHLLNQKIAERFTEAGIHVVLLDRDIRRWPNQSPYDMVGIDNARAGCLVAAHLLDGGSKNLAFVSRENPADTVQLRQMGCREALIQRGFGASSLQIIYDLPNQPGKTAETLLSSGVDGVICSNDATASVLLRSLVDAGAEIPKKIKVCGFDDVKYASLLSVPLTSYQQPCGEIGIVAAEVMAHRIRYPNSPVRRLSLQGKLIVRESSRRI
ncbi:MAG: GntR family transcriptional regulator [Verrucomicrobiales bacterium]|nr:GntR family transcriptional regulator [Verrucomicrobiales bacterium]